MVAKRACVVESGDGGHAEEEALTRDTSAPDDLAEFRRAAKRCYLGDGDPRQGKLWLDAIALELRYQAPANSTRYEGLSDDELQRLLGAIADRIQEAGGGDGAEGGSQGD